MEIKVIVIGATPRFVQEEVCSICGAPLPMGSTAMIAYDQLVCGEGCVNAARHAALVAQIKASAPGIDL